jgi:hypothetical protein
MVGMILLSLPSVQTTTNKQSVLLTSEPYHYWGANLLLLIILYSFIIGCRYYVGIDYEAYLEWYLELKQTGIYPREIEFGYEWLNYFLYFLGAHYAFLFIILAFLQILFFYKSLEKFSFLIPWYIFFFFTYLLMFSSMNIMRQTLAYFLFFYALNLAIDKQYLRALLYCLLGFSFHKSIVIAIALFPLLGFDWFKNKYVQIALLLFVTVFASQILAIALEIASPIVSLIGYGYYVENLDYMYEITEEGAVGAGTARILFFILDMSIIWYSDELKTTFKSYDFYKYYNIYFLGAFMDRIVYDNFILARTNDYLLNFRVLILSFLCYYLFASATEKIPKVVLGSTIALMMLAFFYRAIYNSAAQTSPFNFIFFE